MTNKDKNYSDKKTEYVGDCYIYSPNSTYYHYFQPDGTTVLTSASKLELNDTVFTIQTADEIFIKSADSVISIINGDGITISEDPTNSSYFKVTSDSMAYQGLSGAAISSNSSGVVNISGYSTEINATSELFVNSPSISYDVQTSIVFSNEPTYTFDSDSVSISNSTLLLRSNNFEFENDTNFNFPSGFSITSDNESKITSNGEDQYILMNSSNFQIRSNSNTIELETDGTSAGDVVLVKSSQTQDNGSYYVKIQSGSATKGGLIQKASGSEVVFSHDGAGYQGAADASDLSTTLDTAGGLAFISTNADFAENLDIEDFDFQEYIEESTGKAKLPEGMIVYGRNNKCRSSAPGIPMVVSSSAMVIGNMNEDFLNSVSFCGQLKVLVKGAVSSGDLLVPNGNTCLAVNPNLASMKDYVNAIGMSAECSSDEDLKKVNCFVGRK